MLCLITNVVFFPLSTKYKILSADVYGFLKMLQRGVAVHFTELQVGAGMQLEIGGLALSGVLEQESQPAPRAGDIMLYFWLSSGAFRS